jgi:tRNA (cytidine/uridine-2'-O-)-methyltransferase
MHELNIVLIEPEIPQNTGNIARTCAATGTKLHLVGPMGFNIDDRKLKRAGLDYWHLLDITYYNSTEEFFEKHPNESFYYFSTKAPHKHTDITYPEKVFIVFGKETKGLPEKLLFDNPNTTVRIPMISDARSLNLSNSVAIGVYEVLRQWGYPKLQENGKLREFDWKNANIEN